jgi:hypothetical protein
LHIEKVVYDIDEQSALKIDCQVDSWPPAHTVEWRRYITNPNNNNNNSSSGSSSSNSSGNNNNTSSNVNSNYLLASNGSVLEFKSIKYADNGGYYVCYAANRMSDSFGMHRIGETKADIYLNVRFMPRISMPAKKAAANVSVNGGATSRQKHNIKCLAMANPQPTFNW